MMPFCCADIRFDRQAGIGQEPGDDNAACGILRFICIRGFEVLLVR